MTKEIKIGDKYVVMCATALTPITYRQIFGGDLIKEVQSFSDAGEYDTSAFTTYARLGFVFAKRAEGAEMSALTEKDFEDWLDDFTFMDVTNAIGDIAELYVESSRGSSKAKK